LPIGGLCLHLRCYRILAAVLIVMQALAAWRRPQQESCTIPRTGRVEKKSGPLRAA